MAISGVKSCQVNIKGGKCFFCFFFAGSNAAIMFQLTFTSEHLIRVTFARRGLSVTKSEEAAIVTREVMALTLLTRSEAGQ